MTPGPLGYAVAILIRTPLVVWSFNVPPNLSSLSCAIYVLKSPIDKHPNHATPPPPSPISPVSHSITSFLILLVFLCSMLQLLVTANVVPSLLIPFPLMMEAIHSSITSVLTRATSFPSQRMAVLRAGCSVRFYVKLIAVISHYNYCS
jgi:hypothetical protein